MASAPKICGNQYDGNPSSATVWAMAMTSLTSPVAAVPAKIPMRMAGP